MFKLIKNSLIVTLVLLALACRTRSDSRFNRNDNSPGSSQPTANAEKGELKKGEVITRTYHFKEAKKDQSYLLYIPKSYKASSKTPLVVILHGLRSTPERIMGYKGMVTEAEKRGYILAAPWGYNERGWYGSMGPGKGIGSKSEDPKNLGELSKLDVMNVLKIVKDDFNIDSERTFLLGHSMGGGGTLHLGETYPDKWSGLVGLAPAYNKGKKLPRLKRSPTYYYESFQFEKLNKNVPVFIISGDRDRLVPIHKVRSMVEEMKSLKVNVKFKEIKRGNHSTSITNNPKMIAEVFDFFDGIKK